MSEVLHGFCPPHVLRGKSSHLRVQRPERREGSSSHRLYIAPRTQSQRMHSARLIPEDSGHHLCGPCDHWGLVLATAYTQQTHLFCAVHPVGCRWIIGFERRLLGSALYRQEDKYHPPPRAGEKIKCDHVRSSPSAVPGLQNLLCVLPLLLAKCWESENK